MYLLFYIASKRSFSAFLAMLIPSLSFFPLSVEAQAQTQNSSTLTNSAAPSASSVTNGGTNINYQTNNAYQNEFGFAPGIFCRTPTLFVGGNYGEAGLRAYDPIQESGNRNMNYSFNAGITVPFGSPILSYCRQLAAAIAVDREISSQLSMLRTCAQLEKEGISVDPDKFPLLEPCAKPQASQSARSVVQTNPVLNRTNQSSPMQQSPPLRPKTTRVL